VIYVGIDDTDTLDAPGTNQLARHLVYQLAGRWRGQLITRHQLLEDPRVPCTRRNGCVAIAFESMSDDTAGTLVEELSSRMLAWCPIGSDPGLCVTADAIPDEVVEFGRTCQRQLVSQTDARALAEKHGITLVGLGGTQDGVIGALAAVGLMNTRNDGRVIYVGESEIDHYDISGVQRIDRLPAFGVDEVRRLDDRTLIAAGTVDLGKRLRPNYRDGRIVLFVSPSEESGIDWHAERIV
jgi:hypothetical protein